MEKHKIRLYLDLFFFLFFFPLLLLLIPVGKWTVHHPYFLGCLLLYLVALYFFYQWINIPGLFLRKKFAQGVGGLLVVLCAAYLFIRLFGTIDSSEDALRIVRNKMKMQSVWYLTLIITGYCFSNNLLVEFFKQSISKQKMEAEKNNAELALYKAQINPHFLFNTFNTLYGLLITRSDKTEEAFEKFISMMKYMYANANRDFIPIEEEVEYITQYVDLQSLRLNENTEVSFERRIENPRLFLPPMLLITFVENAFKYGVSSAEKTFIRIVMRQKGKDLSFSVENPVFVRENKASGRVGIRNCKRRLELLYPERHRLSVTTDKGIFRVELNLMLIE